MKSTQLKIKPSYVALLAALGVLTACETMEGLGRDTQKAGGALENSAEKNDGNSGDDAAAKGM